MPNGVENFVKNLPKEYLTEYPNLGQNLTQIAPELGAAKDACDAGEIASEALQDIFSTEYSD